MPIKVTLRKKPISGNRSTLYLDFYPAIKNPITGKETRREFLKMYLYNSIKTLERKTKTGIKKLPVYDLNPGINETYETHNIDTLNVAEQIRQKRQNQLYKPEIYSGFEQEQLRIKQNGEKDFVQYFLYLADKRKASNYDNWISASHYLKKFTNGSLKFSELNESFCYRFREYIINAQTGKNNKKKLSKNSSFSYFNKFKAALKQAYKDDYLSTDINSKIESLKPAETRREFLTLEELNSLVKTECTIPILKQAALFSALTGLRFSDIKKLTWHEVEFIKGNGYFLKFQQQKTDGIEMMPISEQAYNLLGERKEPGAKIFEDLIYSAWHNMHLSQWLQKAGITKHVTFHGFRHTYATLQLSLGTDIYTVSKMLGHRDLKTTQVYAKIISQTKRDAANKIKLDL